jgi:hypothetical protein
MSRRGFLSLFSLTGASVTAASGCASLSASSKVSAQPVTPRGRFRFVEDIRLERGKLVVTHREATAHGGITLHGRVESRS